MTSAANDTAAREALAHWGGAEVPPRLISERENVVYEVRRANGDRAALRLHRGGYNSPTAIQSELWWTGRLAAKGFPTPAPIPTLERSLAVVLGDGRLATMLEWVDGAPIGASGQPLTGDPAEQRALYRALGGLLARLHNECDELSLPLDFNRRNWNIDGFLGEQPLWGRFWENPALTAEDVELVQQARNKAIDELDRYVANGADRGLIHADALRENVFQTNDGLALIDFDDSGFGFRLYDITTALSQGLGDASYPDLKSAILEGYVERRTLDADAENLFGLFAMLRSFASLGWVMPRLQPDHPGIPRFVRRARLAAQSYLELA